MRDPNRIPAVLEAVRAYWEPRSELRLGQILANAARATYRDDAFYIEDEDVVDAMRDGWLVIPPGPHEPYWLDGLDVNDPARIPVVLEALRVYWTANSDLRLGQIVENAADYTGLPNGCYGLGDDEFLDVVNFHTFNR